MIEKNRDILSGAINKMEQRRPESSLWKNIADKLDQRGIPGTTGNVPVRLPEYKAPSKIWQNIIAKLSPVAPSFWQSSSFKVMTGIIATGTITTAFLLAYQTDDKQTNTESEAVQYASPEKEIQLISSPDQNKADQSHHHAPGTMIRKSQEEPSKTISWNDINPDKPVVQAGQRFIPAVAHSASVLANTAFYARKESLNHLTPITAHILISSRAETPGIDTAPSSIRPVSIPDYYQKPRMKFHIGAFYAFSILNTNIPEGMDIPLTRSSAGIDFQIAWKRWSLNTGAEYLSWTEKGNYLVDYLQNKLIYQYYYVDSAHIDPYTGQVIYYTSERKVYDSVPGQLTDVNTCRYRYLQIPLVLEYRVFENKTFSVGLLAGVGFDIRLQGQRSLPGINLQDARITGTGTTLRYHSISNWRTIAGLQLAYRPGNQWAIFIEPSYQLYMKPYYDSDNTKKTGLLKIRAGLHFFL